MFVSSSSTRLIRFVESALLAPVLLTALACASGCIKREPRDPNAPAAEAAAPSEVALPDGTELVLTAGIDSFEVQGTDAAKVEAKPVTVEGQPFPRAVQAKVKEAAASEWAVQLQARTAAAVEKGDVMLATFYARVVEEQEEGGGETQFVFERAGAPYTKSTSYSVRLTPEWRKIQVRFLAAESYPPGGAQMIFRLGYEPETIEVGGVSVQNFGKKIALAMLPTTESADRKLKKGAVVAKPLPVEDGGELAFEIDTGKVLRPISPYVYGINSQNFGETRATVRRNGGNRGSVYNWENNASNAGSDWHHQSDDWPCSVMNIKNCGEPAAQFIGFHKQNQEAKADTVVTVPMLDWVAADKKGDILESEKPPSKRVVKNLPKKPAAFAATPDLNDGVSYQDEFVNYLVTKVGRAGAGGPRFYSLDNEPALWPTTHPRIHPERATYEEVARRSEATALGITGVDPGAFILGGVMFGWSEYMSLSTAPDSAKHNATFGTYVDFFLDAMARAEKKHGRRLMHALDIHWYPEARGSQRITEDDASYKTIEARVQAPRSLWDPSYVEKSPIAAELKQKPIRLLRWFLEIIEKRYPGTKLTMTEYNYGGTKHVSGGLAQADVLGIFGREGVHLATYWGNGPGVGKLPEYVESAFKLYRNYDGKGAAFGDTAVTAKVADDNAASIYAATDTKRPGVLTLVVINKSLSKNYKGKFKLTGPGQYTRATTYVMDGASPALEPGPTATVQAGELKYALPPLTATLIVLDKG
jgi:hypothetical protein